MVCTCGRFANLGVEVFRIDAEIGEAEHAGEHRHEHVRVAVVQIPLERVERGEHPLVHLLVPGEVAGRGGREDFRHHGVILVGDGAVVVAVVVVLIFRIARLSSFGPAMAGCGVVHHEVEAQADACRTQFLGERGEVFVGAERRVDGVEILHCVTAVILRMRHFQQWHQVQIGEFLFLQVRHFVGEFLQIPGEQIGVHGHTEHVAALVPFRIGEALGVETLQIGGARIVGFGHQLGEVAEGFVGLLPIQIRQ